MRNPNGYGSVVKLSGNRRRPFHVRKTIGFNEKGHPIFQTLDYTATREEGMILLATYNKDPWDVDKANMTLGDLFDLWWERKAPKMGTSSQQSLKSAYNHCKSLKSYKYTNVKAYHMIARMLHLRPRRHTLLQGCPSMATTATPMCII